MASISPQEFKRRIQKAQRELEEQRKPFVLRMLLDTIAIIKQRVQTSGTNSQGKPFAPYNPIYAIRGRQEKGFQSSFVDFTRSGRLWASIIPKIVDEKDGTTTGEIGARDRENQDKVNGAFKKRGNILRPTKAEIDIIQKANNLRVQRIIESVFEWLTP